MARLPARVDWIIHERTGVKIALRLDKNAMEFQAEYGGQTFRSSDGSKVRRQVEEAIEESHQLTFMPIIQVVLTERRGGMWNQVPQIVSGVEFSACRFYYAAAGRLRKLKWDHYEGGELSKVKVWTPVGWHDKKDEDFSLPYQKTQYGYEHNYYLPYTDAAWGGLSKIGQVITQAKINLEALLGDTQVIASLSVIGVGAGLPLLTSGEADGELHQEGGDRCQDSDSKLT